MRRWITVITLSIAAVAWAILALIYGQSSRLINDQHDPVIRDVILSSRPEILEAGERLSRIYGCADCHGQLLQGQVIYDEYLSGRLAAPNLTVLVAKQSLPEMEAAVRQGIKPDGTTVFHMPSASLAAMTDRELSMILSHVRQSQAQPGEPGTSEFDFLARVRMVSGALPSQASIRTLQPWRETFRNDELRVGEYLTTVACTQCHGLALEGGQDGAIPLGSALDYDRFEFGNLLSKGEGPGGKNVDTMRHLSERRFRYLTEDEISAIYSYIKVHD